MTNQINAYIRPLQLPVAENATLPTARLGVEIFSTIENKLLVWNGTKWTAAGLTSVEKSRLDNYNTTQTSLGAASANHVLLLNSAGKIDASCLSAGTNQGLEIETLAARPVAKVVDASRSYHLSPAKWSTRKQIFEPIGAGSKSVRTQNALYTFGVSGADVGSVTATPLYPGSSPSSTNVYNNAIRYIRQADPNINRKAGVAATGVYIRLSDTTGNVQYSPAWFIHMRCAIVVPTLGLRFVAGLLGSTHISASTMTGTEPLSPTFSFIGFGATPTDTEISFICSDPLTQIKTPLSDPALPIKPPSTDLREFVLFRGRGDATTPITYAYRSFSNDNWKTGTTGSLTLTPDIVYHPALFVTTSVAGTGIGEKVGISHFYVEQEY